MRRTGGKETRGLLLNWENGQPAAERLAMQLLHADGFVSVDPSHPLGGRDELKDALCTRNGIQWVAAAYFPRGQQSFGKIKKKFLADLKGASVHNAAGFVFTTNQELTLAERKVLGNVAGQYQTEIFHLERITSLLNKTALYGVRLEFLELEMNKEEQLAFVVDRDLQLNSLHKAFESLVVKIQKLIEKSESSHMSGNASVPLNDLKEFKSILDKITESEIQRVYRRSFSTVLSVLEGAPGNINDLHVPLAELREFAELLDRITGHPGFAITATSAVLSVLGPVPGHVDLLRVPLADLQDYEKMLDRVIEKRRQLAQSDSALLTKLER